MKIVLQRVSHASVTVNQKIVGQIERGLLLLVGITHEDGKDDAQYLAEKIVNLRIFEDDMGKMNRSLLEVQGAILSVSQFTLYGDTRKGRRPHFSHSAHPEYAQPLYEIFNQLLRERGVPVATGIFGEKMSVSLENDGPVTFVIESAKKNTQNE